MSKMSQELINIKDELSSMYEPASDSIWDHYYQSFCDGFDACYEAMSKMNKLVVPKEFDLTNIKQAPGDIQALTSTSSFVPVADVEILLNALKETEGHFNSIMSGLTTDINKVEEVTKHRAWQAKLEVTTALKAYQASRSTGESK